MREKIDRMMQITGLLMIGGVFGFAAGGIYMHQHLLGEYEGAGPRVVIPHPPAGHFYYSLPLDEEERKEKILEMAEGLR